MNRTLEKALYRVLRPLADILQRQGVAVGEVVPVLKRAFVDTASDALIADGEKPTTARIAIQVGLTRKDVALIRQSELDTEDPSRYSRVNRVINGWVRDATYQDSKQRPAVLAEEGEQPSLRTLIAQHSGDMPFNSMKEELIRAGAMEERGQGLWELVSPVYLSTRDDEETFRILGDDVGFLIETIGHNLDQPKDTRFQRKVSYNNVPDEYAVQFRRMAAYENQQLLLRLNAWLSDHDRDSNRSIKGTGRMQVGVGIFYFERDRSDDSEQDLKK